MLERKLLWKKGRQQIELIRDPEDPIWEELYKVYERAFPIDEERDSLENLKKYIRFNIDGRFGPDEDPIARDNNLILKEDGKIVAVRMVEWLRLKFGCSAGFATYTFVPEDLRGNGYSQPLIDIGNQLVKKQARDAKTGHIGFFSEINNPLRMDKRALEIDSRVMNPLKRQLFWRRRGYRRVDAYYEQPAVNEGGEPVRYLDLCFMPEVEKFSEKLPKIIFLDVVDKYFNLFLDIPNPRLNESYKRIEQAVKGKEALDLI